MNLISASNPIWADSDQTNINLTVRFAEINEDLPFTASATDPEAHGRDIHTRAVAGEFGTISAYVAPDSSG